MRPMRHVPRMLAFLFLVVALPAQVVRLANYSPAPFSGWKRTTIDVMPEHRVGTVDGVLYVVGRPVGIDTHVLDLRVTLAAGQELEVDLGSASPGKWALAPLPAAPLQHFGDLPRLAGLPMAILALQPDGAGYTVHFRARTGRLFATDLWVTWYPDQPGWCHGEALTVASNPAVPDMTDTIGALPLTFGDAIPFIPGGEAIVPPNTSFGDGQGRAVPITFIWLRHLRSAMDWSSVGAAANLGVCAVGIDRLLADGNPSYSEGFKVRDWTSSRFAESVRLLHTWERALVGPSRVSGDTGAQEDQVFVRGEALLPGGVGAETIAYLAALKMAGRPCHQLEADGSQVQVLGRTGQRLVFWDGRVHWHLGVSPERMGKPRGLTRSDTNGWNGPDVEHWFYNTLAAGARLTGSPALQHLLAAQARIYKLQWTTEPGWSNSSPFAARATGWEGIMAVHLWRDLEDRNLAEMVRQHWLDRLRLVILPALSIREFWDVRVNDARLGTGAWWMPWQQAVGAYGLDLASEQFGKTEGRELALRAARVVLRDAYVLGADGRWKTRPIMAVDGRGDENESFNNFGMPLAVATVLRHDPDDEQARSIWKQHLVDTANGSQSWTAPGVR